VDDVNDKKSVLRLTRPNLVVAAILLTVEPLAWGHQSTNAADTILVNGKVFTAEAGAPFAQAIAIGGDRLLAVGTNQEVEALAGRVTRRIDLQGRVVTPGFNDAHIHFVPMPKGVQVRFASNEPNWEDARAAIQSAVSERQPGTWIFGDVGSKVVLDERVTRFALDEIAPLHPVLLRAFYGHGYIVSSKAMPLLGISEEEPDPMGGYFERVARSKRINGRFWEYADWRVGRVLADKVSDDEAIEQLRRMAGDAIGYGVTTLQLFSTMSIDRFVRVLERADLPIRVHARPFSLTTTRGRDLSEIRQLATLKASHPRVTVSGIKWVLDGTPFEHGAALRQPYHDQPNARGRLNFPESEVALMVKESLELKQPILFHCAGDRCADLVLSAMERSVRGNGDWKSKRVRIEHADGVTDDLVQRAQRLGVVLVLNPTHFAPPELIFARYSPNTHFFALRSYIDAGIPVALGSDGPMNPFLNMMLASIHPSRPVEAVPLETAVRAYTFGSAFAEFAEHDKGTLLKGRLADLTVLSRDIFAGPIAQLPETRSVLAIVGGKIVHDTLPRQ
jgi:predicted amidohydrolase YtcJ